MTRDTRTTFIIERLLLLMANRFVSCGNELEATMSDVEEFVKREIPSLHLQRFFSTHLGTQLTMEDFSHAIELNEDSREILSRWRIEVYEPIQNCRNYIQESIKKSDADFNHETLPFYVNALSFFLSLSIQELLDLSYSLNVLGRDFDILNFNFGYAISFEDADGVLYVSYFRNFITRENIEKDWDWIQSEKENIRFLNASTLGGEPINQ